MSLPQQRFDLDSTGMNFRHVNTPPFDLKTENLNFPHQAVLTTHQSIPSPPCSIPDQHTMLSVPSPAYNSIGIIDFSTTTPNNSNNTPVNTILEEQHHILNSNNIHCSTEFNGQDAAAAVAAAEQHMQQQQMILIQQVQQQVVQQQQQQVHQQQFAQFDDMSREQLIARLVELEKEKLANVNVATNTEEEVTTEEDEEEEEEEEEENNSIITEQLKIRTCLWTDCGEKFDILQKLITHITEIHVGGGKPTYRCEWQKCSRSNKPFTKRHKMYNHLRTHTGERPFACPKPDCEKKFSRPDSLTTHIKTHSNVRPFVCNFKGCGKAYYHSRSLKKHEKIHETVITPATIEPPSYEQVMAAAAASNTHSSSTGQVPLQMGHFVDSNISFYPPQQFPPFSHPHSHSHPLPLQITTQFNINSTANYMMDPSSPIPFSSH